MFTSVGKRRTEFLDVPWLGNKAVSFTAINGINGYARFEGPATIDQLIEVLHQGHGVALPGADLLMSNAYDRLVAIGESVPAKIEGMRVDPSVDLLADAPRTVGRLVLDRWIPPSR